MLRQSYRWMTSRYRGMRAIGTVPTRRATAELGESVVLTV